MCVFQPWSCFQWFKDTNLKANHNLMFIRKYLPVVVSNGSKILIWKQITTILNSFSSNFCCFQWFKDTNLKANHNTNSMGIYPSEVVSNGSKILIWKQITTFQQLWPLSWSCFQWFKDTNLKANHNLTLKLKAMKSVVSNGSKILIWKQITTSPSNIIAAGSLFPMVQRY